MKIIFWIFFLLIVYCYFGYPLILGLLTKVFRLPVMKQQYEPAVSVVISVFNEEDVIEAKIKNILSLDYPSDKLKIFIGSDGSTDKTNIIVKKFQNQNVCLIENSKRRGKMVTINALVKKSLDEIIVFSDARQIFAKNAIKEMTANFADPKVGCVSGELIFSKKEGATAKGINLYWNYEKFIRSQESKIHSMLGATGAIYAIRRELFVAVPDNFILDDMFIPLKIIQKGYRAIFDETAKAFDEAADSPGEEHRRKARTLFGNYQIFTMFLEMFNPLKSPIAIQLFSHKFLRVMVPFFMTGLFFINCALINQIFYKMIFILQIIFYGMALLGTWTRYSKDGSIGFISKICYIPYVFCLLNFSAFIGFLRFAGAKQATTWEKARHSNKGNDI